MDRLAATGATALIIQSSRVWDSPGFHGAGACRATGLSPEPASAAEVGAEAQPGCLGQHQISGRTPGTIQGCAVTR